MSDVNARIAADPDGGRLSRIYRHSIDALLPRPFLVALYTQPETILPTVLRDNGPTTYAPRIQLGADFLERMQAAGLIRADVKPDVADFMAASQVPWGVNALAGAVTAPAWREKKSWYLVAGDDKMIPPPAQRMMAARAGSTVKEVAASHSVYVSQPAAVASIIEDAAKGAE